jgi:hypothetical protein
VISYWYFTFTEVEKQSVSSLMCSLIRDICSNRRDTPDVVQACLDANHGNQRPTMERLMDMLQAVLKGFDSVYLIIDALDECPKSNGERAKLLDTIDEIFSWRVDQLHIFVTSRREIDIQDAFDEMPEENGCRQVIEVQGDKCQEDIEKFLEQRLEEREFARWTPELKKEVKLMLGAWADGM